MRRRGMLWVLAAGCAVFGSFGSADTARAQGADPFMGQLMLVPYQYCPRGWIEANGTILSISQNSALFSLYGTTYGGDGVTTFAVPNLQSRMVIGQGQGPGLSPYVMGQAAGTESVTLNSTQMPMHTHIAQSTLKGSEGDVNTPSPNGALLGTAGQNFYTSNGQPDQTLSSASVSTQLSLAGGSQPFQTLNPYLALRWCVSMTGIYPSRP